MIEPSGLLCHLQVDRIMLADGKPPNVAINHGILGYEEEKKKKK
jgi:hypothetical protein